MVSVGLLVTLAAHVIHQPEPPSKLMIVVFPHTMCEFSIVGKP